MVTIMQEPSADAEKFGEPPAHFDELWALFGDHHQERRTLNATGSVQDVTRTPPRTPFVPFGHSSAGASSKRATTDNEVNSPKKSKRSKDVGEYLADISDNIRARSAKPTEAEEMAEVMQMLRDDGVSQKSELFLMACDLFQKRGCREQYKNINDREDRLTYITWTWKNGRNAGSK